MDEELKRMANPMHAVSDKLDVSNELSREMVKYLKSNQEVLARLIELVEGDPKNKDVPKGIIEMLTDIMNTLKCFKLEHRSHRGWGKKVTMFTICLAVIALCVEVATKGDIATFSVAYHYMRGLWL